MSTIIAHLSPLYDAYEGTYQRLAVFCNVYWLPQIILYL